MQLDPEVIIPSLGLATILLLPAILGKFIGVAAPALRTLKKPDAIILRHSMIPRAEIAMVVVYQCRQLDENPVSEHVYAALVLVFVISSILSRIVLRYFMIRYHY